jgi:hypothetical protein
MNKKSDEFIISLGKKAVEYIDECLANTKTHVAGSGKEVQVRDRHIPTIEFFLHIWMPRNHGKSIVKSTYYEWLKSEDTLKSNTIKNINDQFKSLARDIVANEGKGIFYAKNALGMHDKQHIEQKNVDKFDFDK